MNDITLTCPECKTKIEANISAIELKRLWATHCASIKSDARAAASRENGRRYGGRPKKKAEA